MENDLTIIPVLNKIDLPAAQPEKYAEELAHLIGCEPEDCLRVSGKTGEGVAHLLDEIVRQFPPPVGDADAPARAMIFDSVYDVYRGVVTYVRVIDGRIEARDRIKMMSTGAVHELLEIGVISPEPVKAGALGVGEVGYLITGVKDVRQSRVGDTVTINTRPAKEALGGYKDPKPMVYSGLYPIDGSDYPDLRDALDKLKLNDAALVYEPETSAALGFGFRCGFLGLLHLEIIRERLEREFNLDLISTAPNVVYRVVMEDGTEHTVTNPSEYPTGKIAEVYEPVVRATVLTPNDYVGAVMELCQGRRGALLGMDYLSADRVELRYTLPLGRDHLRLLRPAEEPDQGLRLAGLRAQRRAGGRPGQGRHPAARRAGRRVLAPSCTRTRRTTTASTIAAKLRELIPRQQFEVPIQAAIGSPGHRPRDHPRHPQGRARQVLRR